LLGKEPAQARAHRGTGVPALKSLLLQLPQEQSWQAQAFQGVQYELAQGKTSPALFSAFTTPAALESAWNQHEAPYLTGAISLDEFINRVEMEVNAGMAA
jgi:hypothetical protein